MKWQDEGIILDIRPFGEKSFVITLLTPQYGKRSGLYKKQHCFEKGQIVHSEWSARLIEHLGVWSLETVFSPLAFVLNDPLSLCILSASCQLCYNILPDHHSYPQLYHVFKELIQELNPQHQNLTQYILFEITLLRELGFGLDLTKCAVSQSTENLVYVSPKTGRAVSKEIGNPYRSSLLPLPAFLLNKATEPDPHQLSEGLFLTGYFLKRHLLGDKELPFSRERLKHYLECLPLKGKAL